MSENKVSLVAAEITTGYNTVHAIQEPGESTIATEDQFEEFKRLLDTPLPSTTKFEKLFARPSVFLARLV